MSTSRRLPQRLALAALACLAACSGPALGDPSTALSRQQEYFAAERLPEAARLGRRIVISDQVSAVDRAEAAFLAGEAEFRLGDHARAFERYRYVLENAPWSEHAAVIEERLFAIGQAFFFAEEYGGFFGDRARGVAALETLASHFRTSERADDALKLVGDYFASADVANHAEAALAYLRLVETYPDSEWAERCLWLAGHNRLLHAQGAHYDRNDLLRARELLQRSLTVHPRGVALREVRADLAACEELLAESEVLVADFYRGRRNPTGELLRLANAALLYPQTLAGRQAAERLLALGLDPATLGADPRLNSMDAVRATRPLWEQERDRDADASRSPGSAR